MAPAPRGLVVLDRLLRALSVNPEPAAAFRLALNLLEEALGGLAWAAILLLDQDAAELHLVASLNLDPSLEERFFRLPAAALSAPPETDQPWEVAPASLGLDQAAPLVAGSIASAGLTLGSLLVDHPAGLAEEDRVFLGALGHLLGLIIEQAGLIDQLNRDLARIEDLRADLAARAQELEREALRSEEASRHKSRFLARLGDDIRTPLHGVLGLTELALAAAPEPRQRQYLQMIQSSAEPLARRLNDLLEVAGLEAGRVDLAQVPFDLQVTVARALAGPTLQAEAKGLRLSHGLAPATPLSLRGDPHRLRQVLAILLDNAVKFTAQGEVELRVSPLERTEEEAVLAFSVRDTGPGLDPARQADLFAPFRRIEAAPATAQGGAGLGLAIARHLVELLGGRLTLTSVPGQGSTFAFTARFNIQAEAQVAGPGGLNLTGLTALVVEDNPTERLILREMLATWGMEAVEAADLDQALARLAELKSSRRSPALAILEGRLAGPEGCDLAARIKTSGLAPGARWLILTAAGQPGDARRCREIGVDGYLTKPVGLADLRLALEQILGRRGSGGEELVTRHTLAERLKTARVLLAEENPVQRMVIEELLQRLKWSVDAVDNGPAARAALQAKAYDLVLVDLELPAQGGLDLARFVRGELGLADLPLVALTTRLQPQDREAGQAGLLDDCLVKPVRSGDLLATLVRHLSRRPARPAPSPAAPRTNPARERREGGGEASGASFGERQGELGPLDLAEARSLVDGDRKLLALAVAGFLADYPLQLQTLQDGLTGGRGAEAAQAARRLKGGAAQLAALEVKAWAARIEDLALVGELAQAAGLIPELAAALAKTRRYLEKIPEVRGGQ